MRGLRFQPPESFGRIRFVLVQPSHPGNVGAAARAMGVMGLSRLVVVQPRFADVLAHPDAIAFASAGAGILAKGLRCESLEEALEGVSLAVAVSASPREFGPVPQPPEAVAAMMFRELESDAAHEVALVFGPERTGLSIEATQRCQALVSIPTASGDGSLNLAQAVQVLAYALSMQAGSADASSADLPYAGRLASHEATERLFEHLERSMVAIGFIDPDHPKKLMPRLRRLLSRTRLEQEEVDLLRGICTQIDRQVRAASREKP